MDLPASAALWFLPVAVPLCLATMWTDLTRMKIPNRVTDALLLAFIPLGLIALPFDAVLWQLLNPVVMLALGLALHALRAMGAGDIKFMVAAAPYVFVRDLGTVLLILCAALILGFALHRLARISPLRQKFPDWQSWADTKRFPMGLSLGPALIAYLALAAIG